MFGVFECEQNDKQKETNFRNPFNNFKGSIFDTYYGKYIVYDIEGGDTDA